MTESDVDPGLFTSRSEFLERVIERLGEHPCDFRETFQRITAGGDPSCRHRAAGVLLPLLFRESTPGGNGQFVVQLIKRSSRVSQPGDLSFPGGMLHPVQDRLLRCCLTHGPFPVFRGKARTYARQQHLSYRLMTLFLTNALRESWEEIRLSPVRVRFLGPLPTYSLTLFQRTIFPLAGLVENAGPPHPNREVEKVLEIPLAFFFRPDLFGCYQITHHSSEDPISLQYPCLIYQDSGGGEEILWGATFNIIVSFLRIVTGFRLPDWRNGRVIFRNLRPDYLTGFPPS